MPSTAKPYRVVPLDVETWPAFSRLVEKHHGVWNGCWCTWFHRTVGAADKDRTYETNRAHKERLVEAGKAHAALVFDGDNAVAWCQYGAPEELPNIYHRKQYLAEQTTAPDWRITCFFVDRDYRRKGVAAAALRVALELIARSGGGVVEAYPHDLEGKKISGSFLYSGTRTFFEKAGFTYDRPKGQGNCVMRREVAPS